MLKQRRGLDGYNLLRDTLKSPGQYENTPMQYTALLYTL